MKQKATKETLRNISFDDVQTILEFAAHFAKQIENPELLTDAAESLKLAIELQDPELIDKAKQQIIIFLLQDKGSAIDDPLFKNIVAKDEVLENLFDD